MSAKKKAPYTRKPRTPKEEMPVIQDDVLEQLEAKYQIPSKGKKDEVAAKLWNAVSRMKGWMVKKKDPYGFRKAEWHKICVILDKALIEHNTLIFDEFAKAWQTWEIEKKPPRLRQTVSSREINPWKTEEQKDMQKVAEAIDNLCPVLPTNRPKSRQALEILWAIGDLQRKENRAPTRREIEDKTSISKNKVGELIQEMGLQNSLSFSKVNI